jgi:hypothetical protein
MLQVQRCQHLFSSDDREIDLPPWSLKQKTPGKYSILIKKWGFHPVYNFAHF